MLGKKNNKEKMKLLKHLPNHWSDLRRLQEIKLISTMYIWIFLVPIAAQLLDKVSGIASFTVFDYTFDVLLKLPFSWKVFYFSSLCFALANIIYGVRCPTLIKDHPTYSSFTGEGKPEWHMREYAEEVDIDFEQFKDDLRDNMENKNGAMRKIPYEEWNQSLFWHVFWDADRKRTKAFYTALTLYISGFILVVFVVFQNLYWVLSNAIF